MTNINDILGYVCKNDSKGQCRNINCPCYQSRQQVVVPSTVVPNKPADTYSQHRKNVRLRNYLNHIKGKDYEGAI